MDPATIAALFSAGSGVLKTLGSASSVAPPPPQRADGYALGGESGGSNSGGSTGGSTGGAYGGAWGQSAVDGANWVVNFGSGAADGGGQSQGIGGLAPMQTNGGPAGVSPQSPFSQVSPGVVGGVASGSGMMLVLVAAAAYFALKR